MLYCRENNIHLEAAQRHNSIIYVKLLLKFTKNSINYYQNEKNMLKLMQNYQNKYKIKDKKQSTDAFCSYKGGL